MTRKLILTLNILLLCAVVAGSTQAANGKTEDLSISAAGYTWHCSVHVPAKYDGKKQAPLVLVLHGAGGEGSGYLQRAGWSDKSDQAGFIVAAPNGLPARPNAEPSFLNNPRLWNSGQLNARGLRARIDDITFFKTLLRELESKYKIDSGRVYLTGHSNGAGMTFNLGAEMADKFAAIAAVAGICWVPDPKPSRPLPTLFIIGLEDKLVPFAGGTSVTPWETRTTPPVSETLSKWATAIGCETTPKPISDKADVKIVRYLSKKPGGADLTAYFIRGQGHNWPGAESGLPEKMVGPNNPKVNATDVIWDFFSKHTKS